MKGRLKTINGEECFFCHRQYMLEIHHIFPSFNRLHSEEDGLCVWLCHYHHNEPPYGVHYNRENMLKLKRIGQMKYEENHSREEWMERYGKNYL